MKFKQIISIYFISSLFLLFGIILTFYNYSYNGYYTDKIICWLWLFINLLIIILYWKKEIIKIYLITIIILILLSIIPMGLPFFGMLLYSTTINDFQKIEIDKNYRIERTRQQPLSMMRVYVYEQNGILEKNICRPSYDEILTSVLNIKENENLIDEAKTEIQNAKLISINNDSIGIEYQILNKKKIIYHILNENDGY